jgi:A/G-specific adenine glycosylase
MKARPKARSPGRSPGPASSPAASPAATKERGVKKRKVVPAQLTLAVERNWAEERAALLEWYDAHARDLPWRRTRDPYAIWVSEIMLQQTRVETVVPYYGRFLARFPSATALADAPLDDVLAHWSGLGYYRRARLLHEGAKAVVREHQGKVPHEADARRAIPGVGRYTAGAIGSIAFDLPEPIVDGNVARVLARLHGIATPLGTRETEQTLWQHAEALAQGERPGALNQALMELGARVCMPIKALCEVCPVASRCVARKTGRVAELPVAAPKKAPKAVKLVALVAQRKDGAVWLVRGEGSLFGGLWGCPLGEGSGRALAQQLAEQHGLKGKLAAASAGRVEHVLTHRALTVDVFALEDAQGAERETLRCVSPAGLDKLGIAKLTRKLLAAVP